jgi:hypothetical protein
MAELATIRVEYVGKDNNVLKVESKQKIKDRLHRSPDRADALVLAFAERGYGSFETPGQPKQKLSTKPSVRPITAGLRRH